MIKEANAPLGEPWGQTPTLATTVGIFPSWVAPERKETTAYDGQKNPSTEAVLVV